MSTRSVATVIIVNYSAEFCPNLYTFSMIWGFIQKYYLVSAIEKRKRIQTALDLYVNHLQCKSVDISVTTYRPTVCHLFGRYAFVLTWTNQSRYVFWFWTTRCVKYTHAASIQLILATRIEATETFTSILWQHDEQWRARCRTRWFMKRGNAMNQQHNWQFNGSKPCKNLCNTSCSWNIFLKSITTADWYDIRAFSTCSKGKKNHM